MSGVDDARSMERGREGEELWLKRRCGGWMVYGWIW